MVFIGLLSGMAAALAAVAWIVPWALPTTDILQIDRGRRASALRPDPALVQQTRQRMLAVYDARKRRAGSFYHEDARIADGILLSSDGWAVVPLPLSALPDPSVWEGVDTQGVVRRVQRTVADPRRGITFVQFDGEGFRIMPFFNWDRVDAGTALWALEGGTWKETAINAGNRRATAPTLSLLDAGYSYALLQAVEKRSILLGDQGELAGFSDGQTIDVPAWLLNYELRSILERGSIQFFALPWRGVFVTGQVRDGALHEVTGFYIDALGTTARTANVKVGDVVLRVNGKPVDAPDLPRHLLSSPDTVTVTLLRDGKEMETEVEKTLVQY